MYDESLVNSEVCVRCGACCSVYIEGELIACPHLRVENDLYLCGNYEKRPDVCRQYSCLAKANRNGTKVSEAVADRVRSTVKSIYGRSIELVLQK